MDQDNRLRKSAIKHFKLIGTGNNGVRHRYSVEKNEGFKKAFVKFMKCLDFDEEEIVKTFWGNDKNGERIELKISEFNDICIYYHNKLYELDVFYGNRKIILVIRTGQKKKRDRRKKMIRDLRENSKWRKPITLSEVVQGGNNPLLVVKNK